MIESKLQSNCCRGEKSFPKLMVSRETRNIYLMQGPTNGTVVYVTYHSYKVGEYCEGMDPKSFMDYDGQVILENE